MTVRCEAISQAATSQWALFIVTESGAVDGMSTRQSSEYELGEGRRRRGVW
jgi:hypothetical protein